VSLNKKTAPFYAYFKLGEKKMQNRKNTILAVAIVFMLSASVLMAFQPLANASILNVDTYARIIPIPNPTTVNQKMIVSFGVDKTNVGATIRANLFEGFTVKATKPDGTTETLGPFKADSTSSGWFYYTPTKVGTYTFQLNFPGQWYNTTAIQRWYKPSQSPVVSVVVQQDPLPAYDKVPPLPTGYWTRPINDENKGWYQIADNWLMLRYDNSISPTRTTNAFAPYTSAPETQHIMWTQPIWMGGVVGGKFGDKEYYHGLVYEEPYEPMILNGRIIYQDHGQTTTTAYGTRCIDLQTGEEIWYLNNTGITFCQTFDWESPNEHGILAYLWSISGQNWYMYDAMNARMILNVTGMPTSGWRTMGPNGEVLTYVLSTTQNTLTLWNTTRAIVGVIADTWSPTLYSTVNASRTSGAYNASSHSPYLGIEWNVTIPDVPGSQAILTMNQAEGWILAQYVDSSVDKWVYEDIGYNVGSIKMDSSGNYPATFSHSWCINRTDIYRAYAQSYHNIQGGIYATFSEDTCTLHCYDMATGQEKWVSEPYPTGWGLFTRAPTVAYGNVYTTGYDGHVRGFNGQTGQQMFDFYYGSSGFLTPYGTWPSHGGFTIADGKIYVCNDEHSPDANLWLGGRTFCIDAYTGRSIWNISGWLRIPSIADGYFTAVNALDNQIYVIGKGPSKTTVSAPQTVISKGTGVMITGTVTDQSVGAKDTPAISDESMQSWMEYKYMQKVIPENATGVKVSLTAVGPSGNTTEIGIATTNIAGSYGIMWTPQEEGQYLIKATFAGSNSYGSSYDMTYLGVGSATAQPTSAVTPTATPTQTPSETATPAATTAAPEPKGGDQTFVYVSIAAVAVILVIAAAAVVLRRRK
jgi:hypothetical protein